MPLLPILKHYTRSNKLSTPIEPIRISGTRLTLALYYYKTLANTGLVWLARIDILER